MALAVCGIAISSTAYADMNMSSNQMTISQIVQNTPSMSTLASALDAANLTDTLNGNGPFTLFAPSNDAFSALPNGTLQNLMKPNNKQQLASLLAYHVVKGNFPAARLKSGSMTTMNGQTVQISVTPSGVMVNNSMVTQADIMASNGVIHVLNAVLMPPMARPATN